MIKILAIFLKVGSDGLLGRIQAGIFALSISISPLLLGEEGEKQSLPQMRDIEGGVIELDTFRQAPMILEWVNFSCPCVRDHYRVGTMPKLQGQASARGVRWVAIASTVEGLPGFMKAEELRQASLEAGVRAEHLVLDVDGAVAQAFDVVSSPHVILLVDGKVFYSGPPAQACGRDKDGNMIETGRVYLQEAIDAALSGGQSPVPTAGNRGCLLRLGEAGNKLSSPPPLAGGALVPTEGNSP